MRISKDAFDINIEGKDILELHINGLFIDVCTRIDDDTSTTNTYNMDIDIVDEIYDSFKKCKVVEIIGSGAKRDIFKDLKYLAYIIGNIRINCGNEKIIIVKTNESFSDIKSREYDDERDYARYSYIINNINFLIEKGSRINSFEQLI